MKNKLYYEGFYWRILSLQSILDRELDVCHSQRSYFFFSVWYFIYQIVHLVVYALCPHNFLITRTLRYRAFLKDHQGTF